jgi:hypothetical protein
MKCDTAIVNRNWTVTADGHAFASHVPAGFNARLADTRR